MFCFSFQSERLMFRLFEMMDFSSMRVMLRNRVITNRKGDFNSQNISLNNRFDIMKKEEEGKVQSTLVITPKRKESQEIQYKNTQDEKGFELSDDEKEKEFQKLHAEYIADKLSRKKEVYKIKREAYGSSSSEEDDVGGSQSQSNSQKRHSNFQEESHFKEKAAKIAIAKVENKNDKIAILFQTKKQKQNWSQEELTLGELSFSISGKNYFLKEFHKIKIICEEVSPSVHRIKLSKIDQDEYFIAASISKEFLHLPVHYYIFSSILQQKLINMGLKLQKVGSSDVPGVPETIVKNSYIYGKIFKKSQILGKWEERLIVINKEGIYSYKRFNEKHSMFISGTTLKEIWTRFEIEEHRLVIKILHSSTKTEFGIPLTEMVNKKCWLYNFYALVFKEK